MQAKRVSDALIGLYRTARSYEWASAAIDRFPFTVTPQDLLAFCASEQLSTDFIDDIGPFVSALINHILGEDEVLVLKTRPSVFDSDIGMCLRQGHLVLEGDVRKSVGQAMEGGRIVVRGNGGCDYGNDMGGGELIIEGPAAGQGLNHVRGGHAVIRGFTNEAFSGRFGGEQEGGLIEVLGDVPALAWFRDGVGSRQRGGELRVHGNVHCCISKEQLEGRTHVRGNVVGPQTIGEHKGGGETIIDGDCLKGTPPYWEGPSVGFNQYGGLIIVRGDVHGSVAFGGHPKAEVIVEGNVYGDIGDWDTHGTKVTVRGSLMGNVGYGVSSFECTIHGDVKGEVGLAFGADPTDGPGQPKTGRITIMGSVDGDVATDMRWGKEIHINGDVSGTVGRGMMGGEVHIGGTVGKLGPALGGRVYVRGKEATHIRLWFRVLKLMIPSLGRRFGS